MTAIAQRSRPDVAVIGAGLVGLATAAALADIGMRVALIDFRQPGEASPAAAGMLAPSVERAEGAAHEFAVAARDRYPTYLDSLQQWSELEVHLDRDGILEVARDEEHAAELRTRIAPAQWLSAAELHEMEPALGRAPGALLHPDDGAVDNVALLASLRARLGGDNRVLVLLDRVTRIAPTEKGIVVVTGHTGTLRVEHLVVAAGSWVNDVEGLPRTLPVTPVRGQMIAVAQSPLHHVVFGPDAYVVPRNGETLIGATMEHVGFDASTTDDARRTLSEGAARLAPLLGAEPSRAWAGLRPMTPDLLPIIGPDPDDPRVVYACGHSRNGVLMAPLTGDVIASILAGETPDFNLSPFRPDR